MSAIKGYVKEISHNASFRYSQTHSIIQSLIAMKIWTKCSSVYKFKIVGMLFKCTVVMYLALRLPVYTVAEVGGIPWYDGMLSAECLTQRHDLYPLDSDAAAGTCWELAKLAWIPTVWLLYDGGGRYTRCVIPLLCVDESFGTTFVLVCGGVRW